jgi:hypothetical protein
LLAVVFGLLVASGLAARLVRSEMLADLERALPDRDIKAQVKWYPNENAGLTKLHRTHFGASNLGRIWNILVGMALSTVFLLPFLGSLLFPKLF